MILRFLCWLLGIDGREPGEPPPPPPDDEPAADPAFDVYKELVRRWYLYGEVHVIRDTDGSVRFIDEEPAA